MSRGYPSPPRNRQPLTDADAEGFGFHFAKREEFKNDIPFTIDRLVGYLMTQSNVIAAVEGGKESFESVHAWWTNSLGPLFSAPERTFHFGGDIWYPAEAKVMTDFPSLTFVGIQSPV
jgi:hypothetical protein